MSELKDSGNRREFSTGAVRDMAEGKGRMDLLPLDIVSNYLALESQTEFKELEVIKFTECYLFDRMNQFMQTGDIKFIYWILHLFIKQEFGNIETAIMELSCHYEAGARKYAERNWEKGIPCHSFVDSALRHAVKYFRGDHDEPHNRAFMWNLFGLLWMMHHKPELNDLPFNKNKESKVTEEELITPKELHKPNITFEKEPISNDTVVKYNEIDTEASVNSVKKYDENELFRDKLLCKYFKYYRNDGSLIEKDYLSLEFSVPIMGETLASVLTEPDKPVVFENFMNINITFIIEAEHVRLDLEDNSILIPLDNIIRTLNRENIDYSWLDKHLGMINISAPAYCNFKSYKIKNIRELKDEEILSSYSTNYNGETKNDE